MTERLATVSGTDTRPIIITEQTRGEDVHPCSLGLHLWAWLTSGRQACGRCGSPRR